MIAALSYPFLNLVSRPSGGLISDNLGSRNWAMTILTAGIGIGYLLMSGINSSWILPGAIAVTMLCAYFVQAAAGATFGMVPLIKREITGQIAGSVGAYGNVGGVVYLTIYSLTDARTLFCKSGLYCTDLRYSMRILSQGTIKLFCLMLTPALISAKREGQKNVFELHNFVTEL